MRAVERVDESAAIVNPRPARSLHRAGNFQRQFVKIPFALVKRDCSLVHHAKQVAIGGNVVETVVVHADVRDVRGHAFDRVAPAEFQKPLLAGRVELQQRRSKLKALRPFRPPPRGVFAFHGKNRRAVLRFPAFFDAQDFLSGKLEKPLDLGNELLRSESGIDFHSIR